jgi:GntR family transcriptional regulator, transcriptional repressor for pyruvate dehydrogenase complex
VGTAADRAAGGIRALIASGKYGPGDKLPAERDLAQKLSISRPALREGIRRLRSGGVLESRRGAGTYVATVDLDSIFDVRIRLEPLAAERAASRRTAAELAEMRKAVDMMREEFADPERFVRIDASFHAAVAEASGNPILRATLSRLDELMMITRVVVTDDHHRATGLTDVEKVLNAIESQHPGRAAAAMELHIRAIRDEYHRMVDRETSANASLDSAGRAVEDEPREDLEVPGLHPAKPAV